MTGLPEVHLSSLAYTVMHWLPRTYESSDRDPFDLNAPYQRGSVWTLDQRRALIKSLYMGLPVGSIIVSALPYRKDGYSYRIVDGKQRIETIRAFANDEFAIPYEWLREDDRPSGGMLVTISGPIFYSECSQRFRRWFEMAHMSALEFKPEMEWLGPRLGLPEWRKRSDEEILRAEAELYGLVNGGGTPQTDEDMARAASVATAPDDDAWYIATAGIQEGNPAR